MEDKTIQYVIYRLHDIIDRIEEQRRLLKALSSFYNAWDQVLSDVWFDLLDVITFLEEGGLND